MANNIEIIDFFRPVGGRKNLFVSNITANATRDTIQETLYKDFSAFGVIFEIQIFPLYGKASNRVRDTTGVTVSSNAYSSSENLPNGSATGLPTGWYAFVKFYSAMDAGRAKAFLNGRLCLGQPYKISYAKRRTLSHALEVKPPVLHSIKCQELATHYLGFNGWSSRITSIINDSDLIQPVPKICFIFSVRIDITNHGLHSDGVGVFEAFTNPRDPASKGQVFCRVKKMAYQKALENAFSKIVIIVLANGKVTVEVNTTTIASSISKVNEIVDEPVSDTPEDIVMVDETKPPVPTCGHVNHSDILKPLDKEVVSMALDKSSGKVEEHVDILTDSILDDFNMQILQELEDECL